MEFKNSTILIVEDEVLIANDLKSSVQKFGFKNVIMAHDEKKAIELIEELKPDLVLLDIFLDEQKSGLKIGDWLHKKHKIPFMYITSHSDLTVIQEIINTAPAGYITKPFKQSDLYTNIARILMIGNRTQKQLIFKDGFKNSVLNEESILYIESDGNYIKIHHDEGKILVRKSLEAIATELDSSKFIRIHRSYIVLKSKIDNYSSSTISMGEIKLPISRKYAADFKTIMAEGLTI